MLRTDLVRFIQNNLVQNEAEQITAEDSLIDAGIVHSMGLMRIMQFVESQTGVRIPDQYVTPDNFQSVTAIEEMVETLRAKAAPR